MKQSFYKSPVTGNETLLELADYPIIWEVLRKDGKYAVAKSPTDCIIATAIKRMPDVVEVFISSGKFAFITFKAGRGRPAITRKFTINSTSRKVIDDFDQNKKVRRVVIRLGTLRDADLPEVKTTYHHIRAEKIKNGTHTVTHRATPTKTRYMRIAVVHRPRPKIVRREMAV